MSLTGLLVPLQNLLGTFQAERHYKDERKDQALTAINKALLETKQYIEKSASGKRSSRKVEYRLAELWADAAMKSRYASGDIAVRLQNKSLFWSGDLKWSREEVLEKQIDLDSIQKVVKGLLENK
jgi:hypothetical protein